MIPKGKELKLIRIYLYVCDIYDSNLRNVCERFSNNSNPDFSDQDVMTIYLYSMSMEQRLKIKQIHEFASDHLRSWLPLLPSFEAFNMRINRLSEAFRNLSEMLLSGFCPKDCDLNTSLRDSLPIITCSGKRSPSVAGELTEPFTVMNYFFYSSYEPNYKVEITNVSDKKIRAFAWYASQFGAGNL